MTSIIDIQVSITEKLSVGIEESSYLGTGNQTKLRRISQEENSVESSEGFSQNDHSDIFKSSTRQPGIQHSRININQKAKKKYEFIPFSFILTIIILY